MKIRNMLLSLKSMRARWKESPMESCGLFIKKWLALSNQETTDSVNPIIRKCWLNIILLLTSFHISNHTFLLFCSCPRSRSRVFKEKTNNKFIMRLKYLYSKSAGMKKMLKEKICLLLTLHIKMMKKMTSVNRTSNLDHSTQLQAFSLAFQKGE